MKYFIFGAFFLFFAGLPLLVFFWSRRRLICRHYTAMIASVLDYSGQKYHALPPLRKIVGILIKNGRTDILEALCRGETSAAVGFFEQRGDVFSAAVLEAFIRPAAAAAKFEALIKKYPDDSRILAELAKLYWLLGKTGRSRLAVEKISSRAPEYVRAVGCFGEMMIAAADGDLNYAADSGIRADRFFAASGAWYEEVRCLVFLGTVYRISSLFDAAYIMYKSAENIARRLKSANLTTEILANLGMLMITENRFTDAAAYFNEAWKKAKKHNQLELLAELENQYALLKLLTAQPLAAIRRAKAAFERHRRLKNRTGQAFSCELLSYAAREQNDYAAMIDWAKQAENAYKGSGNLSAYFETMYLQAEGLYLQALEDKDSDDLLQSAEQHLRRILSFSRKNSGCFHPADAYTMLGLIFLRRKEYRRARALFGRSLALEQKDERLIGIAADLANIGLTEKLCGNYDQARKNLKAALEYAAADGENELCLQLQKRLEELS